MIDRNLKKPATVNDVEVRIALRLGVYQLLFLDRIPAHAAIHRIGGTGEAGEKTFGVDVGERRCLRKMAKEPLAGESPVDAVSQPFFPRTYSR